MTELSGTLDGVGLSAIVRFLGGLNKTGCLRLCQQDWHGEVYFDNGQVRHASLGTRTGLSALDALVEALPNASFDFDAQAVREGAPTIDLTQDDVLAHLDEVARRVASGHGLPSAEAIPTPASGDNATEEQLSLDRATLQTLLVVDGRRSVRQIVERRGMDALWHLARLLDLSLLQLQTPEAAGATVMPPQAEAPAPVLEPTLVTASASVAASERPSEAAEPTLIVPQAAGADAPTQVVAHCPKLAFEDDPSSSFGRPTRLHRCFAAASPLPLSLDQQRELCLTDQFATCPRLTAAAPPNPARPGRPTQATSDDPRIVRLPLASRPQGDRETPGGSPAEPLPLRPATMSAPTPLRARLDRAAAAQALVPPTAVVSRLNAVAPSTSQAEATRQAPRAVPPLDTGANPVPPAATDDHLPPLLERRIGPLPLVAILAIAVIGVVALMAAFVVLSQSESPVDASLDPDLPNTSLVAAGTPVSDLGLRRPNPAAAQATPDAGAAADASRGGTATVAQPTPASPSGFVPVTDDTSAATPGATPVAGAGARAPLFDERFMSNDANWPNDPRGAASISNGTYRISTRQAGQFAAVSAPIANVPADLVVNATFKKLAGPPGGGYGILVRDQDQGVRDGTGQDGRYYVLEAGDKGEVGIWRRDGDHWVDLLPWQHSDAVKTGTATNDLSVRAVGTSLSLAVNGTPVATRTDATFANGQVGLFVGGDGNQVGVTRFTIQTP